MITTYDKTDVYKPFLTIVTDGPLVTDEPLVTDRQLVTDGPSLISPKSLCTIDGCYRLTEEKLCNEHQLFTTLEYIIAHKPVQSPVAVSKYNSEQKGLSYVRMHTAE